MASPESDAETLLAHVLGTDRGRLVLVDDVADDDAATYDALVARRAAREPLQHLTGQAHFRHVELVVGPGVFVPRPETELLAGWAIEQAGRSRRARRRRPRHRLGRHREGASPTRCPAPACTRSRWTSAPTTTRRLNLAGTGVDLRLGDLATAFDDLAGTVDVVVSNPPYIPLEAWESVAVEARDHDPALALWSGEDGLDAIRVVESRAALLLRPGGVVGVEHADVQGESAPARVRRHRPVGRRPRPPRPGRSAAICHRAAGTMRAVPRDRRARRPRRATSRRRAMTGFATGLTARRPEPAGAQRLGTPPTTSRERPSPRPAWLCSAASWSCCRPTPSTASAPTPSTPTP